MAEETFNLVFRGEILEGQHPAVVRKRLAALLKLDEARAAALFSGRPVVLKRDAPRAVAAKFQAAFKEAGARLRVTSGDASAAAPAPAVPKSEATAAEAPAGTGTASSPAPGSATAAERRPSLAERLAAEEAAAAGASAQPASAATAAAAVEVSPHPAAATVPDDAPGADAFTLAPAEGDLVSGDELARPEPVRVDVDHLSMAEPDSGSLEDLIDRPAPPPAPDTSALSLDEVGVDLVAAREVVALELDLSSFSLAEPGADLDQAEAAPPLPAPDPDFSLAPPGEELGQAPREPAPPAPDTSHLSLAAERARFATADD